MKKRIDDAQVLRLLEQGLPFGVICERLVCGPHSLVLAKRRLIAAGAWNPPPRVLTRKEQARLAEVKK